MNMKKRLRYAFQMAVLLAVLLGAGKAYAGEVAVADNNLSANYMLGTWKGSYIGEDGGHNPVEREITVYIDYYENGLLEGNLLIKEGSEGKYFFSGTYDESSKQVSFEGEEWLDNPNGYAFCRFDGTVSNGMDSELQTLTPKMAGMIDGDENASFSLSKVSNEYITTRLEPDSVKMDWSGEYDGQSSADGSTVRRGYEMHIESIGEDGSIQGKAMITPSDKEPDSKGVNGSYYFTGKIDFRYGKIIIKGKEWIDYPITSGDWEFTLLSGVIDQRSGRITGSSDDGSWIMTPIDYTEYVKKSRFERGVDTNNFNHTANSDLGLAGFEGVKNYKIKAFYFNQLASNLTPGEKSKIKDIWKRESWKGACYGVTVTMGMVYEGLLRLEDITEDASAESFYTLPYPCKDEKLLSTVHFYNLIQNISGRGKLAAARSAYYSPDLFKRLISWNCQDDSLSVFLKRLVDYASSDHICALVYATSAEHSHTVLITGCGFNEETQKYELMIYDINSVEPENPMGRDLIMTVNKDFSDFSFEDASGIKKNKMSKIMFQLLDLKTLYTNCHEGISSESGGVIIDVSLGELFEIRNEYGETLSYDGESLSGDLPVEYLTILDSGQAPRLLIQTDELSETFTITGKSQAVDVRLNDQENYLSLSGSQITTAELSLGSGMEIQGTDYQFEACISTNHEISAGEKGLISIAGNAREDVKIQKQDDKASMTSSGTVSNVKVTTYAGTEEETKEMEQPVTSLTVPASGEEKDEENHIHKWNGWKIIKEATCVSYGEKKRTCQKCEKWETVNIPKLKPTMKLNVTTIPLKVKQSTTKVKVSGLGRGDSVQSWKSGNTKIVRVTQKGKITAQNRTGKAIVTVTLKSGFKKKFTVKVQKKAVVTTKLSGVKKSLTLKKGKSTVLKPVMTPITSTSGIKYSSSNKKVASVNGKGKITAKKKGKAVITVKSGKKRVTCKVIVK